MRGDIAFVGFMITSDEWQELDSESRASLIAVATRRAQSVVDCPRRLAEGTGKHEAIEMIEADLDDLLEQDPSDGDLDEPLHFEALDGERELAAVAAAGELHCDRLWLTECDGSCEDFSDLNEP